MQTVRILTLALLFGGCALGGDPLDDQRKALRDARSRWEAHRPAEYSYELERLCFCGEEARGPVEIVVRGDSVLSRTYVGDGTTVSASFAELFGTMDDLFEVIEQALERNAHSVGTQYAGGDGHLERADIDYVLNAADDELSLTVSRFTIR